MSLPPVRKRKDYRDISSDDLVFALFYDRIAPRDAFSEEGEQPVGDATADRDRWERKAIKAVRAGKSASVRFESAAIDAAEQERIRAALAEARDVAAVKAAFGGNDDQANQGGMVGAVNITTTSIRRDAVATASADMARLEDVTGHVKDAAVDTEELIDQEWDAALTWAREASDGGA